MSSKNEWRERNDNRAYGNVSGVVWSTMFPDGHPYHRSPIGTPAELDRASIDSVRKFMASYYLPQNATLVIVGPVRSAEVRPLVEKYFGQIGNSAPRPNAVTTTFSPLAATKQIKMLANVPAPLVAVSWKVPPSTHPSWYPLQFGLRPLMWRLRYDFVDQAKVATDVGLSCTDQRLAAVCTIEVSLRPKESPDSVVSVINQRIGSIQREGKLDWKTLSEVRTQFLSSTIFGVESLSRRANAMQTGLDRFNNANQTEVNMKRIDAVTPEQAADAVEQYLGEQEKVVVTVVPDKNAPIGGKIQ
jgi:zinc protease